MRASSPARTASRRRLTSSGKLYRLRWNAAIETLTCQDLSRPWIRIETASCAEKSCSPRSNGSWPRARRTLERCSLHAERVRDLDHMLGVSRAGWHRPASRWRLGSCTAARGQSQSGRCRDHCATWLSRMLNGNEPLPNTTAWNRRMSNAGPSWACARARSSRILSIPIL